MPQKRRPTTTKERIRTGQPYADKLRSEVTALSRKVTQIGNRAAMVPEVVGATARQLAPHATAAISGSQQNILNADPTDDELAILPTGELYMPHLHVRRRLNKAFGTGCYVVREVSPVSRQGDQVIQTWAIDIDGLGERARATGGAEYRERNKRTTWDDAIESAKSIAISRCGKAMGIGLILTDKRFCRAWRAIHCGIAKVTDFRNRESYQWRRIDDEPLPGEQAFADPTTDPAKAAEWAAKVRRKVNDDTTDDSQPARPPQSRSGQPVPGSGPKPAGHGTTSQPAGGPAAGASTVKDGEVLPATRGGFAPPTAPDTPQVFVRAEFVKADTVPGKAGQYQLHRCETVYAVGDGRTGRAEYAFFDPDFLPKLKRLADKQQPCILEWEQSKKTPGQYKLIEWEILTGDVK